MTPTECILAALAGVFAAFARHYYRKRERLNALLLDLRQALRERDAAEREPTRIAFQAGYQLGLQAQQPIDIETECDCVRCQRSQMWTLN